MNEWIAFYDTLAHNLNAIVYGGVYRWLRHTVTSIMTMMLTNKSGIPRARHRVI